MSQSLVQNYQHIVFSTKNREPFLASDNIRKEMHAYIGGVCRNLDSPALAIGGVEDHLHILCRMSKSLSIEDFLRDLKRSSSKFAKTKGSGFDQFHWQNGYGAFSISPVHLAKLRKYIEEQEQHHRLEEFKDEYRRLLKKYGLEGDERYMWG